MNQLLCLIVTNVGAIIYIYRTRFQLEFVFRDAKQFTGLTHCQARNKEALAFAPGRIIYKTNELLLTNSLSIDIDWLYL